MADLTLADLIEVPTALLLKALQSRSELKGKTSREITEMIEASASKGKAEAGDYLDDSAKEKAEDGKVDF